MLKLSCNSPEFKGRRTVACLMYALVALILMTTGAIAGPPGAALDKKNPKVKQVMDVQEEVTDSLMAAEDILGTATGLDEDGEVSIIVYVNQHGRRVADTVRTLPRAIRGVPVTVEITEPFRPLIAKKKPSPTVSHTAIQTPPIQLGTSGGWDYDLANGYCCSATLGSLVQINGTQYILSNYHVFASDIVSGGNNRVAGNGDPIIQPGLIDIGCNPARAQSVASLVAIRSLPDFNLDAGIAQVIPGMVRADGAILEIGTISSQPAAASLRQAVKKSGRTTGLTRSAVAGLNATVSVMYDNECAGGTAFTKVFTGQIVIKNNGSSFIAGGDSGSLMVEDANVNPRPVGLLYAGSSTYAVANPIGDVLAFFGATMVGK